MSTSLITLPVPKTGDSPVTFGLSVANQTKSEGILVVKNTEAETPLHISIVGLLVITTSGITATSNEYVGPAHPYGRELALTS